MRIITLIYSLLTLLSLATFAQEKTLEGIVFDKDTKTRLNRVNIYNPRLQEAVYNNTKAEFSISAKMGDILIAALAGYKTDTVAITNETSIVIFLKRFAIPLPQVTVKDTLLSAKAKHEKIKKEFYSMYRLGNNDDFLSFGPTGVGLSIDAIWSAVSGKGRNARKLEEIIQRDYQNLAIDQRFTAKIITQQTGLTGEKLLRFLINYRPTYYFVQTANQYEFINYIQLAYSRFKTNPYYDGFSLLKPITN